MKETIAVLPQTPGTPCLQKSPLLAVGGHSFALFLRFSTCEWGHGETYVLLCVWVLYAITKQNHMLRVSAACLFNPQYILEIMPQRYLQNHFVLFSVFTVFQSMNTSLDIALAGLTKTMRWLSGPSDRPSPVCMYLYFLNHVSISGSSDQ